VRRYYASVCNYLIIAVAGAPAPAAPALAAPAPAADAPRAGAAQCLRPKAPSGLGAQRLPPRPAPPAPQPPLTEAARRGRAGPCTGTPRRRHLDRPKVMSPTTRQAPLASGSSSAFAANISEASYYTLGLCSGFSLFCKAAVKIGARLHTHTPHPHTRTRTRTRTRTQR
jgi:hypothetical protein